MCQQAETEVVERVVDDDGFYQEAVSHVGRRSEASYTSGPHISRQHDPGLLLGTSPEPVQASMELA